MRRVTFVLQNPSCLNIIAIDGNLFPNYLTVNINFVRESNDCYERNESPRNTANLAQQIGKAQCEKLMGWIRNL